VTERFDQLNILKTGSILNDYNIDQSVNTNIRCGNKPGGKSHRVSYANKSRNDDQCSASTDIYLVEAAGLSAAHADVVSGMVEAAGIEPGEASPQENDRIATLLIQK
jgi:hypothetical protein